MLATNVQYKSNIIDLAIPPEPRPGESVAYIHNGRSFTGVMLGTITTQVKRYRIDGKHPIVVEYVIAPDAGQTNLSVHVVPEQDIAWGKPAVKPVCPRCGGHGYLSIHGDEAQECPVCNALDVEGTF